MKSPSEIVLLMLENDAFSQWLGIELLSCSVGTCELKMMVRAEMLNGHQIMHGGISFSFADSALAFAANSRGYKAVSIETSISHILPVKKGDVLYASAKEINNGKTISRYLVEVKNHENVVVGLFQGTVFCTSDTW